MEINSQEIIAFTAAIMILAKFYFWYKYHQGSVIFNNVTNFLAVIWAPIL